jgi:hypothetical protein
MAWRRALFVRDQRRDFRSSRNFQLLSEARGAATTGSLRQAAICCPKSVRGRQSLYTPAQTAVSLSRSQYICLGSTF